MEQEKHITAAPDAEKTLLSPRFDEEAVSHARPAVPIDEAAAPSLPLRQAVNELTSSRLALLLVLVSMLASGAVGALATLLYQQRHAATPQPAAILLKNDEREEATQETAQAASNEAARDESVTQQGQEPVAEASNGASIEPAAAGEEDSQASPQEYEEHRASLRAALDEWIATTNARDLNRQKEFYMPRVSAFYRARNVSREEVLADKGRAFQHADTLDVRALGQPDIDIHRNGRMATMRFRKQYVVKNGREGRSGEVVQELRWRRTANGWKIVSERDVRVIQ